MLKVLWLNIRQMAGSMNNHIKGLYISHLLLNYPMGKKFNINISENIGKEFYQIIMLLREHQKQ